MRYAARCRHPAVGRLNSSVRTLMKELRIVGASIDADVRASEIAQFVATKATDLPIYIFRPTPGVIMGAAFDWTAILGVAADIIGIAGAFWAAYEHLIRKRTAKDAKKPPKFMLQVKAEPYAFVQIIINSDTTQEEFVQQFVQAVDKLRDTADVAESGKSIQESYDASPNQERVHPGKES